MAIGNIGKGIRDMGYWIWNMEYGIRENGNEKEDRKRG